jgi:hypothetical protein
MEKIDIKELKKELKIYEKKRDEAKNQAEILIKKMQNTNEWKDLSVKRKALDAEQGKLRNKMDKIYEKVAENFIEIGHGWNSPYYRKSEWGGGVDTNIYDEVIEAVKMTLRISKLRHSDIEKLVKNLINKGLSKTKYYEIQKKYNTARSEESKVYDRMRAMETEQIRIAENAEMNYSAVIRNIETKIKNPEYYEKKSDKDLEREKVDDAEIIEKIYNDFRSIEMEDFE